MGAEVKQKIHLELDDLEAKLLRYGLHWMERYLNDHIDWTYQELAKTDDGNYMRIEQLHVEIEGLKRELETVKSLQERLK
jgi:hypothetical protein